MRLLRSERVRASIVFFIVSQADKESIIKLKDIMFVDDAKNEDLRGIIAHTKLGTHS